MEDYERILLVKPEVFVYKIPPRTTNRGFRAADWKLDAPDWTGRLRVVTKGNDCIVKLEDKMTETPFYNTSWCGVSLDFTYFPTFVMYQKVAMELCKPKLPHDTLCPWDSTCQGELFAMCPVDKYPGIAVEAVTDSSRYFVLRIQDGNGRSAFIGIGFADRGDSFDLNVALSDHFKWLQKAEEMEQEKPPDSEPQLDLRFKEGETIKINVNFGKKGATSRPKPKVTNPGGTPGILPPPPGGLKLPAPPSGRNQGQASPVSPSHQQASTTTNSMPSENSDSTTGGLLLDLGSPTAHSEDSSVNTVHQPTGSDLWGDFTNPAKNGTCENQSSQGTSSGPSWAQF